MTNENINNNINFEGVTPLKIMEMDFLEWKEKYRAYETDGIPDEILKQVENEPGHIWTEIRENGEGVIQSGIWGVNASCYWYTEIPLEKGFYGIITFTPESDYRKDWVYVRNGEDGQNA